jgi:hypothetical protein
MTVPKVQMLSAVAVLALVSGPAAAAATSGPIIVTAETGKTSPPLSIERKDVIARVKAQPVTIASWDRLRDHPAGLELWILIDDGSSTGLGVHLNDIRRFIHEQPAQTKVGIGYIQNGTVITAQKPTIEHAAAAKATRLPKGIPGIAASPYIALADFLHKFRSGTLQPREFVVISSGIDPYYGPGPQNPYLLNAMHDAQKAGVPVNTIYFSAAGSAGRSNVLTDWGQNDLSQLSEGTGGKFYWEGTRNPVALKPFFDDLNHRFTEQYVMRLEAANAQARLERLQLNIERSGIRLVAPAQSFLH